MNANDILVYGHLWVLKHVEGLTEDQWETPSVCGWWSVKNIIAHLASFEHVLADIFKQCVEDGPTPTLDQFIRKDGDSFNAVQVDQRKSLSPKDVLDEYRQTQAGVMKILPKIPLDTLRTSGTLPWYGKEYDMEDFIVYSFYGHKREHCAQIAVYRDTLK
jgi:DinB family protein